MVSNDHVPDTVLEAIEAAEGTAGDDIEDVEAEWLDSGAFDVDLGEEADATVTTLAGDIQVTPQDSEASTSLVREDGVQVLTELTEGDSQASFDVVLPDGAALEVNEEGGYDIALTAEGSRLDLGQVEAPWAVDAEGKQLETSYELVDGTLVQHVDTSDAAFPVVADPRLTFGWGVYLNMYGTELKAISALAYTSGTVAALAACQASKLPAVLGKIVRAMCVVIGGPSVWSIIRGIVSIAKNKKISAGKCYQTKLIPRNNALKVVKAKGNCY